MNDRSASRGRGSLQVVGRETPETDPSAIPVKQLRCRSGHHPFPLDDWEPPAAIPSGVAVMFASEGRYKLVEPCPVCWAATRVTYTHPGGGMDGYLKSGIVYGDDWVRLAMHQARGRRVMRDEKIRRGRRQLDAFIGRAITNLADEDQGPGSAMPPVAPVQFRGA